MRDIFYDFEFLEDGATIDPVSIGMADLQTGDVYYAVFREVRWERIVSHQFKWVRENVWPHLPTSGWTPDVFSDVVKWTDNIAEDVRQFILGPDANEEVRLWGDWAAYDHVALAQLWGPMSKLPSGIPMRTRSILDLAEFHGLSPNNFPEQEAETKHHALHDAIHNLLCYKWIMKQVKEEATFSLPHSTLPRSLEPNKLTHSLIISESSGVQISSARGNVQNNTFGIPYRAEG